MATPAQKTPRRTKIQQFGALQVCTLLAMFARMALETNSFEIFARQAKWRFLGGIVMAEVRCGKAG